MRDSVRRRPRRLTLGAKIFVGGYFLTMLGLIWLMVEAL